MIADFQYRPEGAGIDFDKIERHVSVRSSKLLKPHDSVFTPEFEPPVPRTRPSSAAHDAADNHMTFKIRWVACNLRAGWSAACLQAVY